MISLNMDPETKFGLGPNEAPVQDTWDVSYLNAATKSAALFSDLSDNNTILEGASSNAMADGEAETGCVLIEAEGLEMSELDADSETIG